MQLKQRAARHGLRIVRSRVRNPNAYGYGGYLLVDDSTRMAVLGSPVTGRHGVASLDEIRDHLDRLDSQ